ncbi:ABC transporter family substrate-binding protein [Pseudonocardia sp.]|uniref:ABC transporter family substrate-binding protein n=1 Tax=Pseudonocardia sp. TaxID=60912 RepID=UPI003D0F4762
MPRRPVWAAPHGGAAGPLRAGAGAAAPGAARRRARLAALLLLVVTALLAACTTGPTAPEPPVPEPPAGEPGQPVEPSQLVVAVDDLGAGFNPHLLAHRSPTTTAVASLVLPSVFRPDGTGALELDTTVVTSAEVISQDPFTVSYEIDLRASWSTNAPIAAEDFVYLWERMRSEPGVADAAGYRMITDVRSRAGGKAVDVVFSEPYPDWRLLFSGLLPAHILKDAPGSWTGALTAGLPASGGPFRIVTVDRGRGEIVLGRNDLYWATPTTLDQLVFRRLDPAGLPGALASGDADVALTGDDTGLRQSLSGIVPAPRVQRAPQPSVTQLALRTDDGPLADAGVRRAVAALVDHEALRTAVAPDALPADAFGRAPSQAGYAATAPPPPDPAEITRLLTTAGWTRGEDGWAVDGEPVGLVVGAAAESPTDVRIAQLVAAQLRAAGLGATVVAPPGVALYAQRTVPATAPTTAPTAPTTPVTTAAPDAEPPTPTPSAAAVPEGSGAGVQVDITVLSRPLDDTPGPELAASYLCPPASALVPDPPEPPGGSCIAQLRPLYVALLAGVGGDTIRDLVERELWARMPALPLFQPVTLVVSTRAADAATGIGPGPLTTGPTTGAERWAEPER